MSVDGATGCLGSLMRLKEQHEHLQLILSIGGGAASQNFAAVAATAATRDNFGRSAKGLVDASGFDGIDIDWEHPADPEQGRDFLALLAAVRLHLDDNRYILTAALPAGQVRERWLPESPARSMCSREFPDRDIATLLNVHLLTASSGCYKTSISTKPKITSTSSTLWPTTLPVPGLLKQAIMLNYFLVVKGSHQDQLLLVRTVEDPSPVVERGQLMGGSN